MRAAIAARIIATPVDAKASARDVFRVIEFGQREVETAPSRAVLVRLTTQPQRANFMLPQDLFTVQFDIMVGYSDSSRVDDRLGDDSERLIQSLEGLPGAVLDIVQVRVSSNGVDSAEGFVSANFTIMCEYRLTAGV